MSILIRGAKAPRICGVCPFERNGWPDEWEEHCMLLGRQVGYFGKKERKPEDCPIIEVATPSAERWVPCSERLPEATRKSYWVCTDNGGQHECRWTDVNPIWTNLTTEWHWNIFDLPQYAKVVAWMPLPEPYEEHSMEEFMQGQDPGDPEDGRL